MGMEGEGGGPLWVSAQMDDAEASSNRGVLSPSLLAQGQSKPASSRWAESGSSWSSLNPVVPRMSRGPVEAFQTTCPR